MCARLQTLRHPPSDDGNVPPGVPMLKNLAFVAAIILFIAFGLFVPGNKGTSSMLSVAATETPEVPTPTPTASPSPSVSPTVAPSATPSPTPAITETPTPQGDDPREK